MFKVTWQQHFLTNPMTRIIRLMMLENTVAAIRILLQLVHLSAEEVDSAVVYNRQPGKADLDVMHTIFFRKSIPTNSTIWG